MIGPVEDYLAGLPDERRTAIAALREMIAAVIVEGHIGAYERSWA